MTTPYAIQVPELRTHALADVDLRVRVRVAFVALAPAHEPIGLRERLLDGARSGQRILEQCLAEIGEIAVVCATERAVPRIGRRDDERRLGLQRVDEDSRVARRCNDDPPANTGVIERAAQIPRAEILVL